MSETTRKKKIHSRWSGGLEGTLDLIAWVSLIAGFLYALGWMIALPWLQSSLHTPSGALGIAVLGFFSAVWKAFVVWALFRAAAEVIRLLKKGEGLPYGGKITEARDDGTYECCNCGAEAYLSAYRCYSCDRVFTGVGTEENETEEEK